MKVHSKAALWRKDMSFVFFLWAALLFFIRVILRFIYYKLALDFLLTHTVLANLISACIYSMLFLICLVALRRVKSEEENWTLRLWGFLLFIIQIQELAILFSLPEEPTKFVVVGIPIDIICFTIGMHLTYQIHKNRSIQYLSIFNVVVMLVSLFAFFLPETSNFRLLTVMLLHYSILPVFNFIVLGVQFQRKGGRK